ncbi:MAG TPA: MaoC/PaaZ C-terminal domain-containing protein [Terricaulis sp.]|nr:MaoC/PaaZ C-terminal domain-containing protein [Terricaulis sp.]
MMLALGETLTTPEQAVKPEMMHVWAKVLRDPNPIHTDVEAVRARGLGDRVINQGPGNISYIMNMLLAAFPAGRLAGIKVRFLDNVFGGELVTPSAVVLSIEDSPEGRRFSLAIALHAEGRLVLDGDAIVLTPSV